MAGGQPECPPTPPECKSPAKSPAKSSSAKSPAKPPAKPAGKAKGKAKAKSQSKPKGASKSHPKPAPKLKRPAAADKGKQPSLKRPASKKEDENDKEEVLPWEKGLGCEKDDHEDMEEEEHAQDPVVDPFEADVEKKDRVKDNKLKKMIADGSLPEPILREWNRISNLKSGRVALQRKFVNEIFDRDSSGKLHLALEKEMFKTLQEEYQKSKSSTKEKALPRSLFQGKFGLSNELFQQGLLDGDFEAVEGANGKVLYSWVSYEHASVRGSSSSHRVAGEKELDSKEAMFEKEKISNWQHGLFSKAGGQPLSLPPSGRPLAIMDMQEEISDKQWQLAQQQLKQAMDAFKTLDSACKKALQTIGPDNKSDTLYDTLILGYNQEYL